MASAGRNHHAGAGPGTMLAVIDANDRLAIDDEDDLISTMLLLGSCLLARSDGHHRGLAPPSRLQDLEELSPIPLRVHDGCRHLPLLPCPRGYCSHAPARR